MLLCNIQVAPYTFDAVTYFENESNYGYMQIRSNLILNCSCYRMLFNKPTFQFRQICIITIGLKVVFQCFILSCNPCNFQLPMSACTRGGGRGIFWKSGGQQ